MSANPWCDALCIAVPRLEDVKDHREAKTYNLLVVALLEQGRPMTLEEVAQRFADAGVAEPATALRSLKRCRPARPPVYREGDAYHLDPYDDDADLILFMLDLRPPLVPALDVVRSEPEPSPGPDVPLTPEELDLAWTTRTVPYGFMQRVIVALLDAHRTPLAAEDLESLAEVHGAGHVDMSQPHLTNRGSPVRRLDDGRWTLADDAGDHVRRARAWVREFVDKERQRAAKRPHPAVMAARREAWLRRQRERNEELASLRRVLVAAYPRDEPRALVMVDVETREIASFEGDELADARERLASHDLVGAEGVRALCRALDLDPDRRRLAELGPPRKTLTWGRRSRPLRLTTDMLIEGTCGIRIRRDEEARLRSALERGHLGRLRQRLEARVKALHAYYLYGMLHHAVRLCWGPVDEQLPVRWAHPDEPSLRQITLHAFEMRLTMEVIDDRPPSWDDPWASAREVIPGIDLDGRVMLVDTQQMLVDPWSVQRVRVIM